jgi:hypothetical protein
VIKPPPGITVCIIGATNGRTFFTTGIIFWTTFFAPFHTFLKKFPIFLKNPGAIFVRFQKPWLKMMYLDWIKKISLFV